MRRMGPIIVVLLIGAALTPLAGHGVASGAVPIDVVALASAPDGEGYVIAESDGVVWAYGSMLHRGDLADVSLSREIVAVAATPSGAGYWLVASDGGVFAFGDAGFFGSLGAVVLNAPIVAVAATPSGAGYWLVASDGGVFAFGNAPFLGSMGAVALNQPVMTMSATSSGAGYRLLAGDGGEFDFGDAGFIGSAANRGVDFAAGAVRPQGDGHWLVTGIGQLQQSGLAARFGAPTPGPPPSPPPPLAEASVQLVPWASFTQPMAVRARPGDSEHLYVAERAGRILRVLRSDGSVLETMVDITGLTTTSSERGLLGFDFSPDGRFIFLNHTDLGGNVELVEYDLSVKPARRRFLLEISQPFGNHNGGDVHVSQDGLVWASSGDGGSGGDPGNNAQNRSNLLGTIYRIDPTASGSSAYTVPPDNPFVGQAGVRPEIWSYGLRNPWRFDIDDVTGDIWIGDVGQGRLEEINREPGGVGGTNHGWKRFEGDLLFADVPAPSAVGPLHAYDHDSGCSVTGGVLYRGSVSSLSGAYVFADFCAGTIWGLRQTGGVVTDVAPLGVAASQIVQFGTDLDGELYVVQLSGAIQRLVAPG